MPAKKPAAKPKGIDLVKEDIVSLTDRLDALASRVAFLETFRPAIEVSGTKPPAPWWRRILGG